MNIYKPLYRQFKHTLYDIMDSSHRKKFQDTESSACVKSRKILHERKQTGGGRSSAAALTTSEDIAMEAAATQQMVALLGAAFRQFFPDAVFPEI